MNKKKIDLSDIKTNDLEETSTFTDLLTKKERLNRRQTKNESSDIEDMVNEKRKMFHDDSIKINATTVRVPVFRSHSESITIETERPITPERAKELLANAPGVIVVDAPENKEYPMAIHSSGTNEVYVGRIRMDISSDNGLSMWVVADQIRKGAATNAIQIAELLIEK